MSLSVHTCKVSGCGNRRSGKNKVNIHSFPRKESVGLKWVQACQNDVLNSLEYKDIVSKNLFVCHQHFESKCYFQTARGFRLITDSCPTLMLPMEATLEESVKEVYSVPKVNESVDFQEEKNSPFMVNMEPGTDLEVTPESSGEILESSVSPEKFQQEVQNLQPLIEDKDDESGPITSTPKKNICRKRKLSVVSGLSPDIELSPRKRKLMEIIHSTRKENQNMKKVVGRFKRKTYEKRSETTMLKLTKKLNRVQKLFIEMILKNNDKKGEGRRYTTEEKIIALSIYKSSPKTYRFLRNILVSLPAESTLKLVVKEIPMSAGISEETKQRLQELSSTFKNRKQKAMIFMWDEVMLSLGLQYDPTNDNIVGFEDWGHRQTEEYADQALVFMLRSIDSGDNVPISFNFCSKATVGTQIQRCIKEVIKVCSDADLNVVATVCDGFSTNVNAINTLIEDTKRIRGEEYVLRNGTFIVHDVEVVPLFDPPHLIKCIRNNLLDKDLEFDCQDGKKIHLRTFADWNHLVTAYEIDVFGNNRIRSMNKLSAQHVYPQLVNRMSVQKCNQVFSESTSSTIQALAGGPKWTTAIGEMSLPLEAKNTASIFYFFNQVSDSTNSDDKKDDNCAFRKPLTDTSYHLNFFKHACAKLRRMQFVDKVTKIRVSRQPSSLKNLIRTLEGIALLWGKLKLLDFQQLSTKHLNQDPLENFFSLIRAQSGQNRKPTCYQFIGSYKTLVINNLTHYHAVGANCEKDDGSFLITWEKYFAFENNDSSSSSIPLNKDSSGRKKMIKATPHPLPEKSKIVNSVNSVVKQLLEKFPYLSSCIHCKKLFSSDDKKKSIIFELHEDLTSLLRRIMVSIYAGKNICETAMQHLKKEIRLELFTCTDHKNHVFNAFLSISVMQNIKKKKKRKINSFARQ